MTYTNKSLHLTPLRGAGELHRYAGSMTMFPLKDQKAFFKSTVYHALCDIIQNKVRRAPRPVCDFFRTVILPDEELNVRPPRHIDTFEEYLEKFVDPQVLDLFT